MTAEPLRSFDGLTSGQRLTLVTTDGRTVPVTLALVKDSATAVVVAGDSPSETVLAWFNAAGPALTPDSRSLGACPRCGAAGPLTGFRVCEPCTVGLGWEPECAACRADDWGQVVDASHIDTCEPGQMARTRELIEASSLGTPDAVAMRERVSDDDARAVVARARELGGAD